MLVQEESIAVNDGIAVQVVVQLGSIVQLISVMKEGIYKPNTLQKKSSASLQVTFRSRK